MTSTREQSGPPLWRSRFWWRLAILLAMSGLVQCGLPLLLESGHSKKADLQNPADFQRF
jgi:hypothetical protein